MFFLYWLIDAKDLRAHPLKLCRSILYSLSTTRCRILMVAFLRRGIE